MARVVLLLFKHVFAPALQEKLPDILSLMKTLMGQETGLQYLGARPRIAIFSQIKANSKKLPEAYS